VAAAGIRAPRPNFAMNRTRTVVAVDGLGSVRTCLASTRRRSNRTSAGVGASTTRHAASSTSVVVFDTPVANKTVYRAGKDIAVLGFTISGACDAAESRGSERASPG